MLHFYYKNFCFLLNFIFKPRILTRLIKTHLRRNRTSNNPFNLKKLSLQNNLKFEIKSFNKFLVFENKIILFLLIKYDKIKFDGILKIIQ